MLVCGDSRADKREAARADRAHRRACAASTAGAWRCRASTESLTALLIGVNARYKVHAGVRLTGLPDALWE